MSSFNPDTNTSSLPSWQALAFTIPLFLQLHLLHPFYVKNYRAFSKSCRLTLCPIGVTLVLSIPRKHPFLPRESSIINNFFFGMFYFHVAMKFVELAIVQEPYFFVGLPTIQKGNGSLENTDSSSTEGESQARTENVLRQRTRPGKAKSAGDVPSEDLREKSSSELFKESFLKQKELKRRQAEKEGFSQRIGSTLAGFFNMRGIGHSWGPESLSRIPPPLASPTSPHWKRTWLIKTIFLCVNYHFLYVASTKLMTTYAFELNSATKNHQPPRLRHLFSPPILPSSLFLPTFIPELDVYSNQPWFQWISSLYSSISVGVTCYAGVALSHHLLSLIAFLYSQAQILSNPHNKKSGPSFDPRLWSPLFGIFPNPSKNCFPLSEFWSKGWHGLFRRVFQFLGMDLGRNIVRRLGVSKKKSVERNVGIIFAFFWTALLHEWALRQATLHFQPQSHSQLPFMLFSPTMIFFLSQALLIILRPFETLNLPWDWVNQIVRVLGFSLVMNVTMIGWSVLLEGWVDRGATLGGADPQTWSAWRFVIPFGTSLPDGVLTKS